MFLTITSPFFIIAKLSFKLHAPSLIDFTSVPLSSIPHSIFYLNPISLLFILIFVDFSFKISHPFYYSLKYFFISKFNSSNVFKITLLLILFLSIYTLTPFSLNLISKLSKFLSSFFNIFFKM